MWYCLNKMEACSTLRPAEEDFVGAAGHAVAQLVQARLTGPGGLEGDDLGQEQGETHLRSLADLSVFAVEMKEGLRSMISVIRISN